MKKALLTIALVSTAAAHHASAEQPSFNYIEGGYSEIEDFSGFTLRGNLEVHDNIYLSGSHEIMELDDNDNIDFDSTTLGVGFKVPVSDNVAVYTELNYLNVDAGDNSEDGHTAALGLRAMASDVTEFYGEVANYELVETSTLLSVGVRQYFTDNLGGFAEINRNDFSDNGIKVGVSYRF